MSVPERRSMTTSVLTLRETDAALPPGCAAGLCLCCLLMRRRLWDRLWLRHLKHGLQACKQPGGSHGCQALDARAGLGLPRRCLPISEWLCQRASCLQSRCGSSGLAALRREVILPQVSLTVMPSSPAMTGEVCSFSGGPARSSLKKSATAQVVVVQAPQHSLHAPVGLEATRHCKGQLPDSCSAPGGSRSSTKRVSALC